jgi:cysteine synthase A
MTRAFQDSAIGQLEPTTSALAARGNRIDALIGATPMVQLTRVVEPDMAEVWLKLEGMQPAGSIKDRTALGMIVDAERRGILRQGDTIVEPTSGNTGIGLAQVAAARGYKLILCLPSSMSDERKLTLLAFGAELVLTDPERRMLAAIEEAENIAERTGAWMPNQFVNPANPRIHYETTAPELWARMDGRIDAFVYGSGTGGTISGVGRFLKERRPDTLVVAVEPARSPVLSGGERGQHQFQGMGPGFVPANFDRTVVDRVLPAWEEDAFPLARRLAREEGLFVGMSSGAIVWAALQIARELGPGHRVAAISPDSGARYLTTTLFADGGEV